MNPAMASLAETDVSAVRQMIDDLAEASAVRSVVLVSSDGLAMLWSSGLERDVAEAQAALTCSLLGVGRALAETVDGSGGSSGQMVQQFASGGAFIVGVVGPTAGLGVTVEPGGQLPVVVQRMQHLIAGAGPRLAPAPLSESRRPDEGAR